MELFGGGSVLNGAYPSSLNRAEKLTVSDSCVCAHGPARPVGGPAIQVGQPAGWLESRMEIQLGVQLAGQLDARQCTRQDTRLEIQLVKELDDQLEDQLDDQLADQLDESSGSRQPLPSYLANRTSHMDGQIEAGQGQEEVL